MGGRSEEYKERGGESEEWEEMGEVGGVSDEVGITVKMDGMKYSTQAP